MHRVGDGQRVKNGVELSRLFLKQSGELTKLFCPPRAIDELVSLMSKIFGAQAVIPPLKGRHKSALGYLGFI
jgi:hypothetical protein